MRWFKHLSNASDDPTIAMLMDEFGAEGYGVYWIILEKIARNLNENDQTFVTFSLKNWSNFTRTSPKRFQKIINFLADAENFSSKNPLFFLDFFQKNNQTYITINCPKLLKYRDEYTKKKNRKSGQTTDKLQKKSGQSPDKIPTNSEHSNIYILDTDTDTDTDTEYIVETSVSTPKRKTPSKKIFDVKSPEYQLVEYIISRIQENHPRTNFTDAQIQKACEDIEKLIRLDGWNLEEIKTVVDWAVSDEFWKIQFQSPLKLRRKDKDGVTYMAKWWGIINQGNGMLKLDKEVDPNILIDIYEQENKVLPPIVAVTEKRLKKCRERIIAYSDDLDQFFEKFRQAVRKAQNIPFLNGKGNKSGWKADFDWFIDNDENFVKVLEGKYDAVQEW